MSSRIQPRTFATPPLSAPPLAGRRHTHHNEQMARWELRPKPLMATRVDMDLLT